MTATRSSFKQRAHAWVKQLPDTADWKDLVYEASVIQDIEEGLADIAAGRVTDVKDVRREFGLAE